MELTQLLSHPAAFKHSASTIASSLFSLPAVYQQSTAYSLVHFMQVQCCSPLVVCYFDLVRYLSRFAWLIEMVAPSLPHIFCKAFKNAVDSGMIDVIRRLKMNRKLMIGVIHDGVIEQMRVGVYNSTGHDVDFDFDS